MGTGTATTAAAAMASVERGEGGPHGRGRAPTTTGAAMNGCGTGGLWAEFGVQQLVTPLSNSEEVRTLFTARGFPAEHPFLFDNVVAARGLPGRARTDWVAVGWKYVYFVCDGDRPSVAFGGRLEEKGFGSST